MRPLVPLLLLFFTLPLNARDFTGFERVLIPAVARPALEGSNGARFGTTFEFVRMSGPIRYFPEYDVTTGDARIGEADAREWVQPFQTGPHSRLGRLAFIDRMHVGDAAMQAALFSSTAADPLRKETRLPIVRERDFRTGTSHILGVRSEYVYGEGGCRPAYERFRHQLRIYDVDGRGDGVVLVRLYLEFGPTAASAPMKEFTLTLSSREGLDPTFPAYAEIPIAEVCLPFSCHTPCMGGSQRVEIEPVTPGLRYWPLVTATDNFTQQVTLAYPQ